MLLPYAAVADVRMCLTIAPRQLQAVYRGVVARRFVLNLLTSGEELQRWFLMLRQKRRFKLMLHSARLIQRGFRVGGGDLECGLPAPVSEGMCQTPR